MAHRADQPNLPPLATPKLGCCGWCEAKSKYFERFPAIELQSTFYNLPSLALASKWRVMAPPEFHFSLKAWQLITHTPSSPTYRKLKSKLGSDEHELVGSFRPTEHVALAWERTAEIAGALRAKAVLFQCPASFRPERENRQNLTLFFSTINRAGLQLVWEPRGAWPLDLVAGICKDLDLFHCIDPFHVDVSQIHSHYWRLHGKGGYSYRYLKEDLVELAQLLRSRAEIGKSPEYVFFNNVWMKEDARRFQDLLREKIGDSD